MLHHFPYVKGGNYIFNIKGIDHAGRIGSNSQSIYLVFEGMKVMSI